MSAIRDPATITKTGRQMVTAGGDITYTKAVLYGQDISHLTKEQVEGLTSIGDPLVTVPIGISDKNDDGNGTTVVLEATFQNSNLKADLPYKAVGFFAKKDDGDEKLVLVGVATDGAYLAATSPDGVSTDSLDIKIAVAVGDASNVTAVVDPAGSVTPATLNGAISKATHDLTDKINTKADKTDLDSQIGIVTKSVSDLSDTVKANKDDTDKALATKADKATVESDLATKASQSDLDKTNAKVATKADSEDVNAQLATKANSKDVNDALALKDDTADVDDKISNVTKSVSDLSATVTANKKATDSTLATKANASDVADSLATKADKTDVASDVKSLNDAINTKASQADLDQTNAVVATKANATALADYARTVDVDADLDTKANKTDLESLAKTADVNSALDTKADKTTVDGDVKTLQASIDTKADKTALDDYAKSADVASDVKTLTDSIAAKADAKTVNDAISKIDFTPYAKSADVAKDLQGYTTTADLTKLLAGKRDIADSYSRDELDKKFLQLSTDTSGKVSADQIAKLLASKVDKTDLTSQLQAITDSIGTKANSANVTAELAKKDNTADVDAKIKTVTNLANTKANSDDVYSKTEANNLITDAKNTGKQAQATADSALAGYNKRPVISGGASDDLLSFKTTQLRYYPGNGNTCKNLPPATNQQWFTVEYIFENPNGDGIAIYRSPANEIWTIGNNGGYYDQAWVKVVNANDIQGLQNQINTKLASGDLPTELQKITFRKQYVDGSNKLQDGRWKLVKQADGSYLVDLYNDDWTAQRVADLLNQIGSKADTATVNSQVADAKNAANKAQTTADNANNNANGRLSLNGGTMGSTAQISFADSGTWGTSNKPAGKRGGLRWDGQSDSAEIYADEDGSDNLDLVFQIGDDGSNHFSFRNQVGAEVAAIQSNGHYTGTIDWASVNGRPDVATHADVNNKVNVQGNLFRLATAGNTWVDILGVANSDTPVLVSIRDQGSGNLLGNFAAAIAFGGWDTKGVLNVAYADHTARIIGGNGNAPVWHEDIAWKSDVTNLQNQVNTKASASDVNSLNQTISALQQTVQSLQNTVNQQATTITGLQTQVNNQANEIKQLQETTIKGKTFSKSQEAAAEAWEKQNSQQIAFILDN